MAVAKSFVFFSPFLLVLFVNLAESECQTSFNCGFLGTLEFPLSNEPGCGLFLVNCTSVPFPKIQFGPGGLWYSIFQKMSTNNFKVELDLLRDHLADRQNFCFGIGNSSVPNSHFSSFTISPNLTIFSCRNSLDNSFKEKIQDYFEDYRNCTRCEDFTLYYKVNNNTVPADIPGYCSVVHMPRKSGQESDDLDQLLTPEFDLEWNIYPECLQCHNRGRKCVVDSPNRIRCEGSAGKRQRTVIIVSAVAGGAVFLGVCFVFSFIIYRGKK